MQGLTLQQIILPKRQKQEPLLRGEEFVDEKCFNRDQRLRNHSRTATTAVEEGPRLEIMQAWDSPSSSTRRLNPVLASPAVSSGRSKKVQDFLYPDHLSRLKQQFQAATANRSGCLDLRGFIGFFRSLPEFQSKTDAEISTFFQKIDCYSVGVIDWDDLCTYMYLEMYEMDGAKTKAKEVTFSIPAEMISTPHRDSICRLFHLSDGSMVSGSQDGVICFWSLDWKPKRVRKTEPGLIGKPKWVSDMALSLVHSKFILTTGDNEVQFYEVANFEPYCQLCDLESTPLKVDFWSDPKNINNCIMVIGDEQGTVTILAIPHLPDAFKFWKLGPRKSGMPTYVIDKLVSGEPVAGIRVYRWKVHSSWVSEVRYFGSLRVFASCSSDTASSLVMGTPSGSTPVTAILHSHNLFTSGGAGSHALQARNRMPGDQRVFRVPKGVTSFDFSERHNLLVTGGTDQVIRIWNPFVTSKPIGVLEGQGSPLFRVRIDPANDRIYSVSNDNTVKVWDLIDQQCLCTVISAAHKVTAAVEVMHVNTVRQTLILGTDQLFTMPLSLPGGIRKEDVIHSHRLPITAMGYSKCFGLIITACEGSVIKVWDPTCGECVFEFASVHGTSSVTAIDLDTCGRRLVTGSDNGEIKMWNFNNGHCLIELDKGNSDEVTDVKFVSVNQIKYVVAVGWDRKINFFQDVAELRVQRVAKPIKSWGASTADVHLEDITSIAFCPPQNLVTASYDGELVVWSMISGHLVNRLSAPILREKKAGLVHEDGDSAVHKLLFLDQRKSRASATLVASGPGGHIHFWSLLSPSRPKGVFQASDTKCITDLVVDTSNTTLISSDVEGYVSWWDISSYCVDRQEIATPKQLNKWRAHTNSIRCMVLLESPLVLITGSSDTSVRLWTNEGQYIGSFGQTTPWQLDSPSSYQLADPPHGLQSVLLEDTPADEDQALSESGGTSRPQTGDTRAGSSAISAVSSQDEKDVLAKYGLTTDLSSASSSSAKQDSAGSSNKAGKWLRHLRIRSAKPVAGMKPGPCSYATLHYQELNEIPYIPTRRKQTIYSNKMDSTAS